MHIVNQTLMVAGCWGRGTRSGGADSGPDNQLSLKSPRNWLRSPRHSNDLRMKTINIIILVKPLQCPLSPKKTLFQVENKVSCSCKRMFRMFRTFKMFRPKMKKREQLFHRSKCLGDKKQQCLLWDTSNGHPLKWISCHQVSHTYTIDTIDTSTLILRFHLLLFLDNYFSLCSILYNSISLM